MGAQLKGIDVSKWNGVIGWQKVAVSGVSFAMVRAATGSRSGKINIDPKLDANINGAHAAGIKVGVYLYSYAYTVDAARKEADNLVQALAKYKDKITWPVAYDIEEPGQATTARRATNTAQATAFLAVIRNAGYTPMLYCNPNWLKNYIDAKLVGADIWLAHYTAGKPYAAGQTIWQYSSKGAVAGISGNVDLNVAYKDYSVSQRPDWLTPAPAPTPPHEAAIDALYAAGQINSPEYWRQVCNGKVVATADNVRALLAKWAAAIKPQ